MSCMSCRFCSYEFASSDAYVADVILVSPAIELIVVPEVTTVVPCVGAVYPDTAAHWTPVPVVCR